MTLAMHQWLNRAFADYWYTAPKTDRQSAAGNAWLASIALVAEWLRQNPTPYSDPDVVAALEWCADQLT